MNAIISILMVTFFVGTASHTVKTGSAVTPQVDVYQSITTEFIDFKNDVSDPAHTEGRVFWDDDNHTLSIYNDEADITHQLGHEFLIRCKNTSGATISNGQVVYVSGAAGQRPTIALARANSDNTSSIIGIATHDIDNNQHGYITTSGLVNDIAVPTASFSDGDIIYLDSDSDGMFTATKPTNGYVVRVGTVVYAHDTAGKVLVSTQQHVDVADIHGFDVSSANTDDILVYDGSTWISNSDNAFTTGTPADNQVCVFTDDSTIEGDSNLTWSGSDLNITGTLTSSSTVSGVDGLFSGYLRSKNNFPHLELWEDDGTSDYRRAMLYNTGGKVDFLTVNDSGSVVGYNYLQTLSASGVSDHEWRINNTKKLQLDSSGDLTVGGHYIETDECYLRASRATNLLIGNASNDVMKYTTVSVDTHSAYNTSTGVYTAPTNGLYVISASVMFDNTSWTDGEVAAMFLNANGIVYYSDRHEVEQAETAFILVHGSWVVRLNQNETAIIYVYQNTGAGINTYASVQYNWLSIARITGT